VSCIDWYICINLNYIHPKVHILFICYLTSLKYGAEQKCPLLSSYSIKTKSSFITQDALICFTFPHVFYILLQCMRWIGFLRAFALKKWGKKSYWFTDTAFCKYRAYYATASENLEEKKEKKIYGKSKTEVYLHISACTAPIFVELVFASSLVKCLPTPQPPADETRCLLHT